MNESKIARPRLWVKLENWERRKPQWSATFVRACKWIPKSVSCLCGRRKHKWSWKSMWEVGGGMDVIVCGLCLEWFCSVCRVGDAGVVSVSSRENCTKMRRQDTLNLSSPGWRLQTWLVGFCDVRIEVCESICRESG
jgi:hypothetical protein